MSEIKKIWAREIIDSRGNPTVEVDLELSTGQSVRAAVPSGASTGIHEALEMRDHDKSRYMGKGVLKAVNNVNKLIAPMLVGQSIKNYRGLDQQMLELDNTPNKSKLGANAILGVSLALARGFAVSENLYLFQALADKNGGHRLPVPLMNVLNGGAHADNHLDVQEFMIVPVCGGRFSESLRAGCEIFHSLKQVLSDKGLSTAVGDEGGFAPALRSNREALELLMSAIEKCGYRPGEDVFLALDVASTELFDHGFYHWEGEKKPASALLEIYQSWSREFPLISIEDGFAEDDWAAWSEAVSSLGSRLQLVGDDLFVTHPQRLRRGIDEQAANSILVKVNQIGSLSETKETVELARANKMTRVMSHRSGETEDAMIADLAVAFDCEQIKTGSLCRGERTAKYNQLLRIEEILGEKAHFWGRSAFLNKN